MSLQRTQDSIHCTTSKLSPQEQPRTCLQDTSRNSKIPPMERTSQKGKACSWAQTYQWASRSPQSRFVLGSTCSS